MKVPAFVLLAVLPIVVVGTAAGSPVSTAPDATGANATQDADEARNTTDIEPWVAPRGRYDDLQTPANIRTAKREGSLTRANSRATDGAAEDDAQAHIAGEGVLVYQVTSPRLTRSLTTDGTTPTQRLLRLRDGSRIDSTFEQTNPVGTHRDPKRLSLGVSVRDDAFTAVSVRPNDTVFLVFDTARVQTRRSDTSENLQGLSIHFDEHHEASVTVHGNDSRTRRRRDDGGVTPVEQAVRFPLGAGDTLRLNATADRRITGETSLRGLSTRSTSVSTGTRTTTGSSMRPTSRTGAAASRLRPSSPPTSTPPFLLERRRARLPHRLQSPCRR